MNSLRDSREVVKEYHSQQLVQVMSSTKTTMATTTTTTTAPIWMEHSTLVGGVLPPILILAVAHPPRHPRKPNPQSHLVIVPLSLLQSPLDSTWPSAISIMSNVLISLHMAIRLLRMEHFPAQASPWKLGLVLGTVRSLLTLVGAMMPLTEHFKSSCLCVGCLYLHIHWSKNGSF